MNKKAVTQFEMAYYGLGLSVNVESGAIVESNAVCAQSVRERLLTRLLKRLLVRAKRNGERPSPRQAQNSYVQAASSALKNAGRVVPIATGK